MPDNNKPIGLFQWYHTDEEGTMEEMIEESLAVVEDHQRANMRTKVIESREHFIKTIAAWHQDNTEPQYLLIVTHGTRNKDGQWIGIGSSPGNTPLDRHERIEWRELWNVAVVGTRQFGLFMVGCNTANAAAAFNPCLTVSGNNPYLVGLSESVTRKKQEKDKELAQTLLRTTHSRSYLDEDWALIREEFPVARMHYPVVAIKGQAPRYIDVDTMVDEIEMTFRQYLQLENEFLRERADGNP